MPSCYSLPSSLSGRLRPAAPGPSVWRYHRPATAAACGREAQRAPEKLAEADLRCNEAFEVLKVARERLAMDAVDLGCLHRPRRWLRSRRRSIAIAIPWQNFRVHFLRNVLAHAGRQRGRVVSAFIAPPSPRTMPRPRGQRRQVADQLSPWNPSPPLSDDLTLRLPAVAAHRTNPPESAILWPLLHHVSGHDPLTLRPVQV